MCCQGNVFFVKVAQGEAGEIGLSYYKIWMVVNERVVCCQGDMCVVKVACVLSRQPVCCQGEPLGGGGEKSVVPQNVDVGQRESYVLSR